MPSYAVRLRAGYETLATTIGAWAMRCEKVLCYEHDDRHENLHVHLLLEGVATSVDTLKNDMRARGIDLKGAGQLSFKTKFKLASGDVVNITDDTKGRYITYMSKGKYDPKYNKGYTADYIALAKSQWVVYDNKPDHPFKSVYEDFETYVSKQQSKLENEIYERIGLNKEIIRSWAFAYTFELEGRLIHRGQKTKWAMCYETFCIRHDLCVSKQIHLMGQ